MKESQRNEGAYNGPATFDVETALLRELGRDLIGVDPSTLSLREKLRQKKQLANYDGPPIIRNIESRPKKIMAYIQNVEPEISAEELLSEESKGPLALIKEPDTSDEIAPPPPERDITHHFPSLEDEVRRILSDINSPEVEYVRESSVYVLPKGKRDIRLLEKSSDLRNYKPKKQSGKYKPVEPRPIEEGFMLLKEAIPPDDYHAIRQNAKYNQFLKRDEHKRVLVRISDVDALLAMRNCRNSVEPLTPDHRPLYTFADTQEEKSALLEAASHGRIPAVRKKDGWYATSDVAQTYLDNRKLTSDQQRPMTHTEFLRYREFIKSGTFPAKKIRNRWYITNEEIRKFEEKNPSKRKVEI
jgi:hypothetical protein